jgi:hypothetical protein
MLKFMAQSCGAIHGVPTHADADHHRRAEEIRRARRAAYRPKPRNGAAFIVLCSLVVATGVVVSLA